MATTPSTKPFAVTKRKEIMDSAKTLKIIGDELNAKYTRFVKLYLCSRLKLNLILYTYMYRVGSSVSVYQ